MQERRNSGNNQNQLEDRELKFGHPFWPRKQAKSKKSQRLSSIDSGNSSWTEEIFHNALDSNEPLEYAPTSPTKEPFHPDSRNISFQTNITCERSPQFHDSTGDENSFYSQARSDLNQNNFMFIPEQKGFSPSPFGSMQQPHVFKMSPDC